MKKNTNLPFDNTKDISPLTMFSPFIIFQQNVIQCNGYGSIAVIGNDNDNIEHNIDEGQGKGGTFNVQGRFARFEGGSICPILSFRPDSLLLLLLLLIVNTMQKCATNKQSDDSKRAA